MGLEAGVYLADLVSSNPDGSDARSQGDDHLRLLKATLQATFPGMTGRSRRVQVKGGNYTAVLNDNTSLLVFTGPATLSLAAAATLGNGWSVDVFIPSTGQIVVDPAGAELISGAATLVLPTGFVTIWCDGSSFIVAFSTSTPVPAGVMFDFAGTVVPPGYLPCDGAAVSRTSFAVLFAAIGTTWGVGDGSTTFNVPDSRRRVAVGSGGGATGTLGNAVGNVGGEENHALSTAEVAPHQHGVNAMSVSGTAADHVHRETVSDGGGGIWPAGFGTIAGGSNFHHILESENRFGDGAAFALNTQGSGPVAVTGTTTSGSTDTGAGVSGAGHNTIQPSVVVTKIIKV